MKAIQLIVNAKLPPELRDYERKLDSKSLNNLLADVARDYPERYEEIAQILSNIGRNASFEQGETLTLRDMFPVVDRDAIFRDMDKELKELKATDPEGYEDGKFDIWNRYSGMIKKLTSEEALRQGNNLAYSVASGARGKPEQLQAMLTTPGVYSDYKGDPVPLFVRRSFADGLRPAEYLAGAFGARNSVISTKVATAKGGDLCLGKGTMVRMADYTTKAIEQISKGDWVLGSDLRGQLKPVQVVNTFDQGIKNVVKLTTNNDKGGRQLNETFCTEDHKFLTFKTDQSDFNSVIPLGSMKSRHMFMTPTGFNDSGLRSEPFALLAGLFMGDGVLPKCEPGDKSRCMFTCADDLLIKDTEAYLESLDLHWVRRKTNKIQYRVSKSSKVFTHPFKDFVKRSKIQGLRHDTKRLPADIAEWDNDSVGAFIAGYLAADGCITHKSANKKMYTYVSFTSVSERLLVELKTLMKLRFGINSSAVFEVTVDKKTGFKSEISSYILSVGANKDVRKLLGASIIPGVKGILQKHFLEVSQDTYKPINDAIDAVKIETDFSKHAVTEMPCYDIEVDHEDHLFVLANGLITSNSKQLIQAAAPLVVTARDCSTSNGLDLEINDDSLKGRVLNQDIEGVPSGTILDKHTIAQLRKKGVETVIARSPMTCQAKSGVCAKCTGVDARGKLRNIGDSVGVESAQSVGEPICLEENTLVRLADGTSKKIKDMKVGDIVLGSDEFGNLTPTAVLNVFHNGIRECYSTKIRKGKGKKSEIIELVSTKEHKVLSYQGKSAVNAKPVIQPIEKKRSRQFVYLGRGLENPYVGSEESFADIIGVLIGDGCYTGGVHNAGIGLSCYDASLVRYLSDRLKSELNMRLAPMGEGEFRVSMIDQHAARVGNKRSDGWHAIKNWLISKDMWSQSSGEKSLPNDIWEWNNESIAKLIGGYLAADGWITKPAKKYGNVSLGFGSTSKQLIEGIKKLLEIKFGIYCSRIGSYRKPKEDGSGFYDAAYSITISNGPDIRYFASVIPVPGIKGPKILQAAQTNCSRNSERGRYMVVSQDFIGERDTWDIEVDNDTHLFLLDNQLVVSNTQMALNSKHTGGQSGGKKEYSGFEVINRIAQSPEIFPDRAIVSEVDGKVEAIREAPQGGNYVTVNGEEHYVQPGYEILVKPGDMLEAGDQLSDGIVDSGDIVRLRGLGEGRRFYSERLKKALDDSGVWADKRNTEMLARAAIDHVMIDDPEGLGEYLPDDIASYNSFERTYVPPEHTKALDPDKAVGQFLQQPVLHYTVGTKITPRMAERIRKSGNARIYATEDAPQFHPEMVRLRASMHHNPDWLASMHTSYLKAQLNEGGVRGRDTNVDHNVHFAPRLAKGTNFGEGVEETGTF